MKFANDPLWQKINSFPIDDPASFFPFSRKLAQENNWDKDFSQRAIREYKRFIYLCCVLPEGASPPPIVDEVWHLHILYSENYWEAFCDKTLGRKIHHQPSGGGPEEKEKHVNWLGTTIENYRLIFDEDPPEDIWQKGFPIITTHPPPTKKVSPSGFYIIILGLLSMMAIWLGKAFLILPLIIIAGVGYAMFATPNGKGSDSSGTGTGGCSSGCSGGGDSSCGGGGCGGCGGGD